MLTVAERVPDPRYAGRSEGTPKGVRRPATPDEIVPFATFKSLTWPLDDEMAAQIESGRVCRVALVVRFEDVIEYADGRRSWGTSVPEIGPLTE